MMTDRMDQESEWHRPPRAVTQTATQTSPPQTPAPQIPKERRLEQTTLKKTRSVTFTEHSFLQDCESDYPEEESALQAPVQDSTHLYLEALFDEDEECDMGAEPQTPGTLQ